MENVLYLTSDVVGLLLNHFNDTFELNGWRMSLEQKKSRGLSIIKYLHCLLNGANVILQEPEESES